MKVQTTKWKKTSAIVSTEYCSVSIIVVALVLQDLDPEYVTSPCKSKRKRQVGQQEKWAEI